MEVLQKFGLFLIFTISFRKFEDCVRVNDWFVLQKRSSFWCALEEKQNVQLLSCVTLFSKMQPNETALNYARQWSNLIVTRIFIKKLSNKNSTQQRLMKYFCMLSNMPQICFVFKKRNFWQFSIFFVHFVGRCWFPLNQ